MTSIRQILTLDSEPHLLHADHGHRVAKPTDHKVGYEVQIVQFNEQQIDLISVGYVRNFFNDSIQPHDIASIIQKYIGYSDTFPRRHAVSGVLYVRTSPKRSWKKRYFIISNKHMLCARHQWSPILERVTPLESYSVYINQKNKKCFQLKCKDPSKKTIYFRTSTPNECALWRRHMKIASTLKIEDIYRFLDTLSDYKSSRKVVSAIEIARDAKHVIKTLDKRQFGDLKSWSKDVKILSKLQHSNVVKFHDLFETRRHLYLVMEKLSQYDDFNLQFFCVNFECVQSIVVVIVS